MCAPSPKPEIVRFLKSKSIESQSGCLEWTGARYRTGYGTVPRRFGGGRYAHRAMFEAAVSSIPAGMYVLHTCDNRLCINPDHLFLGTHLENIKDMHAKNRQRGGSMPNERNPSCKFSNETIKAIRLARQSMGVCELQRAFGISETHLIRVLLHDSRRGI